MKRSKEGIVIIASAIALIVTGVVSWTVLRDDLPSDSAILEESRLSADVAEDVVPEPNRIFGFLEDSVEVVTNKVRPNQNLSEILRQYQVPYETIYSLVQRAKPIFDVRKITVDRPYTMILGKDSTKTPKCFVYHQNKVDYVVFRMADSLQVFDGKYDVEVQEKTLSGTIESSLYNAIVDQGGSPELVNRMAQIYAWEIDFFGLQKGDHFHVVYEEKFVKGEVVGLGEVKAVRFFHHEKDYFGYSYDQGEGIEYFDEEGESLRKSFLKAPLSFTRISSHFSNSRLHPILKIRRPHHGVDYAAPTGTPVVAIGDGVVIKAKYEGGAGNYVKVKHNGTYTTGYMHLHKFASGLKVGSHVKQGEIIAYVGSTGLSTGPHLDFRIWENGKAVDPLKIDPPSAEPLDSLHTEVFSQLIETYKPLLLANSEAGMAKK